MGLSCPPEVEESNDTIYMKALYAKIKSTIVGLLAKIQLDKLFADHYYNHVCFSRHFPSL